MSMRHMSDFEVTQKSMQLVEVASDGQRCRENLWEEDRLTLHRSVPLHVWVKSLQELHCRSWLRDLPWLKDVLNPGMKAWQIQATVALPLGRAGDA